MGAAARYDGPPATLGRQHGQQDLGTAGHLQASQVPRHGGETQPGKQNISFPGEKLQTSLLTYLYLYFTTQAGKRRCLGEELGKSLIFLTLANIFQRFDVRLQSGVEVWDDPVHGFTLSPKPFKVTMVQRT